MSQPQHQDMIDRLRSEDGPSHRAAILKQLDALDRRVSLAIEAGQPRGAYEDLDAVRLAVAACRTTLSRLSVNSSPGKAGPLERALHPIRSGTDHQAGTAPTD